MAAQYGCMAVVKLLVEHGADLALKDDLYHSTAIGAAEYFGQEAVRDYLRSCVARIGG
jgi:ankyrin repeat protein